MTDPAIVILQRENPCVHQPVTESTGVTDPALNGGVLYWKCPVCGHLWHNLAADHPLRPLAVTAMNAIQGIA